MKTKGEILKDVQSFCKYPTDKAWYVEYAKLEVLLDIRSFLDDLIVSIQDVNRTLSKLKK